MSEFVSSNNRMVVREGLFLPIFQRENSVMTYHIHCGPITFAIITLLCVPVCPRLYQRKWICWWTIGKLYLHETSECELIWNRVFLDVIHFIKMRSYWIRRFLNPVTGVLILIRNRVNTQTHRKNAMWWCRQRLEWCVDKPRNAKQPPEARREAKRTDSLSEPTGETKLPTPWFWTSASRIVT